MRVRRIGIEELTAVGACDRPVGDRHGRRTGVRRSLRVGTGAEELVHDRGREDPAGPALIDRRPDVRRPLDMLDGDESGLQRLRDVRHGLIAL